MAKVRRQAAGHLTKATGLLPGLTNHCFGCAEENRQGLRLKFVELSQGGVESRFRVPRRFEGPPGHVHGGIIATILDEAMGKANRQKQVVALTRKMTVEYLRPVPLGMELVAVGWTVRQEERKHWNAAEIRAVDGTVLARGEGLFLAIDPVEMFRRHQKS